MSGSRMARPDLVNLPVDPDSMPGLLAGHRVVVLHLWAPWNGHDYAMAGMLRELGPSYADRIEFRSRDVDLGLEGIMPPGAISTVNNVPALACFLWGRWLETVIGNRAEPEWRARFDGWVEGIAGDPVLHGRHWTGKP